MSGRSRDGRSWRATTARQHEELRDLRDEVAWLFQSGYSRDAVALARRLLEVKPRDPQALQIIYTAGLHEGQHELLVRHIDDLLRVDPPFDATMQYNLAVTLFDMRRYAEARRLFEDARTRLRARPDIAPRIESYLARIARIEAAPAAAPAPAPCPPARTPAPDEAAPPEAPAAPRHRPRVRISFAETPVPAFGACPPDAEGVRLRGEVARARLARSYDELLCLQTARGVDRYWYQIETVKRALTRFRGRVLLADEVGLGKTVEASMIAAEYVRRGMVTRVLVLVPPSLVAQWRDELEGKFGLAFEDAAARCTEEGFWEGAERVVCSIALARMPQHFARVTSREWDLVIVDEAHRLKNRRTRGWELVNTLRPRFLLMLSATPVQNDLVELYNIVTLLRPGTLGTESEFRRRFVRDGEAYDVDALRELLASVMIRNTRSLIDAKLPARYAETFVVDPAGDEAAALAAAGEEARSIAAGQDRGGRMAAQQLLLQAGSSPAALAAALARIGPPRERVPGTAALDALGAGAKGARLVEILRAKPGEKAIVFVQYTRTLEALAALLAREGIGYASFSGSMEAAEKEEAVRRFRDEVQVLLATASGGEGRNLQFARTVVNFDLPWNPMQIEQRIGRVHRLGQQRDVFVFNLALRGSLEERIIDVLDRKINMFEMVVGEIDDILGNVEGDFAEIVFDLWLRATSPDDIARGMDDFAATLVRARERLRAAKELDEKIFGEDLGL